MPLIYYLFIICIWFILLLSPFKFLSSPPPFSFSTFPKFHFFHWLFYLFIYFFFSLPFIHLSLFLSLSCLSFSFFNLGFYKYLKIKNICKITCLKIGLTRIRDWWKKKKKGLSKIRDWCILFCMRINVVENKLYLYLFYEINHSTHI